ncbi:hypothetical protein ACOME3_007338 [Neoechinorhynchus agilis]
MFHVKSCAASLGHPSNQTMGVRNGFHSMKIGEIVLAPKDYWLNNQEKITYHKRARVTSYVIGDCVGVKFEDDGQEVLIQLPSLRRLDQCVPVRQYKGPRNNYGLISFLSFLKSFALFCQVIAASILWTLDILRIDGVNSGVKFILLTLTILYVLRIKNILIRFLVLFAINCTMPFPVFWFLIVLLSISKYKNIKLNESNIAKCLLLSRLIYTRTPFRSIIILISNWNNKVILLMYLFLVPTLQSNVLNEEYSVLANSLLLSLLLFF